MAPEVSREASIIQKRKRKRNEVTKESFNPRMVAKPPGQHSTRMQLLKLIHQQMVRLNGEVQKSSDPFKEALELSEQELITTALDEEERVARANPAIYGNILKLRVVTLKRMTLADWKKEREKQIALEYPEVSDAPSAPVTIHNGLSPREETVLVQKLVASQEGLAKHGYVTELPSREDIEQARKGVESAKGYETCDRCRSRFQVFPGRRESDGVLTTGGPCTFHPGKARRQAGTKTDIFLCCKQEMGTPGCTTLSSHVFKVSEAKRLALILPFKKTPNQGPPAADHAVCFDCEMGFTTMGLELIRLTATSWPDGKKLVDVLVRPIGEVLDLNSEFSGVWMDDFRNAPPYIIPTNSDGSGPQADDDSLHIVESPAAARELLFSLLTTSTPLMGHALENDLNAVRIIHPTIVDTVLLFPHPRGLPIRHGLKQLVKTHLNKNIQMAGAQGHDSAEDARAAGELIRFHLAEKWNKMSREGWKFENGALIEPPADWVPKGTLIDPSARMSRV